MADFPDDVLRHVFSFLPQETLVQCRLLSRSVEPLASALAFSSIRLEHACDVDPFLNVTRSKRLRPCVRELTIDLSQGVHEARNGAAYSVRLQRHHQALLALPLVRLLSGLRKLNLRFGRSRGHGGSGYGGTAWQWVVGDDAQGPDPSLVPSSFTTIHMEAVLKCISGSWTKEDQDLWERRCRRWAERRAVALTNLALEPGFQGATGLFDTLQQYPQRAINLTTLTISNLSERDAEYLRSSATMARFLETQSLSTLQLLTTSGTTDPAFGESHFALGNKYRFIESLPSTWLSPPLADHLRTLSLFAHDYWGWCPKMDFRLLSRGINGTGGLPNLRTLALGKYVFSHQWQVDWVAQLGSDNGRGGLEELYLDNCPILWRSRLLGPVDSEGFPQEEVMMAGAPHPSLWDPITVDVDLRWGAVLRQWHREMPSLKVFRMGGGDWEGESSADVAMAQTASRATVFDAAYTLAKHRNEDTQHLNYDKPTMADRYKYGQEVIRDGVGLTQKREFLLQYIHFEIALGSSPWVERDFKEALVNEFEDGYQRYEEARRQDEEALYALYASTGSPYQLL